MCKRSDLGYDTADLLFIADVADKRIVCRTSLGFENLLYGFTVSCITAQTVNRLSGESDNFAVPQVLSTIFDGFAVG